MATYRVEVVKTLTCEVAVEAATPEEAGDRVVEFLREHELGTMLPNDAPAWQDRLNRDDLDKDEDPLPDQVRGIDQSGEDLIEPLEG